MLICRVEESALPVSVKQVPPACWLEVRLRQRFVITPAGGGSESSSVPLETEKGGEQPYAVQPRQRPLIDGDGAISEPADELAFRQQGQLPERIGQL